MKRLFTILCAWGFLSICVAQDAHFYLKNGVQLTRDLSTIDSITYVKPDAEVILPASYTLTAGSNTRLSYMVSTGVAEEPITFTSTNGDIAYVYNDMLYARGAGECIVYTTYKGVTSSCVVKVEPARKMESLATLASYAALATFSTSEIGVYMSQALTTTENTQTALYPYRNGWNFGNYIHPYISWYNRLAIPTALQVKSEAQALGHKNVELIARTIQLMATMLATDLYGELPKADLDMYIAPKYQTQQQIYDWMYQEVEDLLTAYQSSDWVNCPSNLALDTQLDPIYGGDLSKWASYCQALKARLWLRKLPNWDNTAATCQKIIAAVNAALTNWQDPLYIYSGDSYDTSCPWGPSSFWYDGIWGNDLDLSVPTTFFLHGILGGIDGIYLPTRGYALDPRAARMMASGNSQVLLHLESNAGIKELSTTLANFPNLYAYNNPYTRDSGYVALMTKEELLFIKAEAQYWAGDIQGAYESTLAATKVNMERYGLDESEILSGALGSNLKNQYERFFSIKLPNAAQFTLADLMQQKYAAMYLQPEQWTDMRRYNYSSSTNGIAYKGVYVYDVKHVHNGRNSQFNNDAANFCLTYSLHRPYNLYEPYWWTAENFGINASLSPNAWVMRLNPSLSKYSLTELQRLGYYTVDASGNVELNPSILTKRMIWAQKNANVVTCADNTPWK